MFSTTSEQSRRFSTEVAYFLLPTIEKTVYVGSFKLVLCRLELLFLGSRKTLLSDPLGVKPFIHFGEVTQGEILDLGSIGRLEDCG